MQNARERMRHIANRTGWVCHYCGHPLLKPAERAKYRVKDAPMLRTDVDIFGALINKPQRLRVRLVREGRKAYLIPEEFKYPTIDHKVPRSKGGTDADSNLLLACFECNFAKADKSYEDFVRENRRKALKP